MVLVVLVVDLVTVAVVVLSVQVGLVAGIILNLLFWTGLNNNPCNPALRCGYPQELNAAITLHPPACVCLRRIQSNALGV